MRYVWSAVLLLVAADLLVWWLSLGPLCFPPDDAKAHVLAACAAAEKRAERYGDLLPWMLFATGTGLLYCGITTLRSRGTDNAPS